jgi:hypothetical protein
MITRTELHAKASPFQIHHENQIMTIGSCFSDEIGKYLADHKFNVLNNPFGTAYNPVSISLLLQASTKKIEIPHLACLQDEVHFDHHYHSSFHASTAAALTNNILQSHQQAYKTLSGNDPIIIITLGTAWAYEHITHKCIVNNCHKQPAAQFRKVLLNESTCTEALSKGIDAMLELNPNIKIVLTLSPVRHLKDGIEENQISKSILRLSIHHLAQQYRQIHYFPSYELVLDDLRDYRYYKSDLIHPSSDAVQYIAEKFCKSYFSESTRVLKNKINKVNAKLQHKPFNLHAQAHQLFLKQLLQELKELNQGLDFTQEIAEVKKHIL